MSDKSSSATNSLPNSPIHSNNNNPSLLNNNNNNSNGTSSNNSLNVGNNSSNPSLGGSNSNALVSVGSNGIMSAAGLVNNNNNPCSANRNVVAMVDDDACFRLDTDATVTYGEKEPDPDNIKMFVGQVPKSMDESQLREMFEEYGAVHSINVLRDKATGISKGKCSQWDLLFLDIIKFSIAQAPDNPVLHP